MPAPAERLRALARHDLPASLVVFLVAVPLSLGIAAASGAPLVAGLVAAAVGGMVAGAQELIPMAAPAGILIVVGAALVKPAHVRVLWRHREVAVYLATALGVIALGPPEGILIGVAAAVLRALYQLCHTRVRVEREGDGWRVVVHGSLLFLVVGRLVRALRDLPAGQRVALELHVDFMDHAAFEAIEDWRAGYERLGGEVGIEEIHDRWFRSRATRQRFDQRTTLPGPVSR